MMRLFVGNIPHACDEQALSVFIEGQGFIVSSAQILRDRETGHSRGFGFVELQDASNLAETIKSLHGKEMSGRALTVNAATPKLSSSADRYPQSA